MKNGIKLKGKYTGANNRGIIIGGVPFMPGLPSKMICVDKDTYLRLKAGVENGWFEIEQCDYDGFLSTDKKEEKVAEPVVEVEKEEKTKKTSTSKKSKKADEEIVDNTAGSEEVKDSSK